ncbi:hypothetical protein [Lysobacter capsici]|uniref:hypothetical protein n=1 Tax=Lysobacter capsici TaxID=435897 RepID=UPI00128FEB88|nr:hypothetical protein [Lysobacter capsici]
MQIKKAGVRDRLAITPGSIVPYRGAVARQACALGHAVACSVLDIGVPATRGAGKSMERCAIPDRSASFCAQLSDRRRRGLELAIVEAAERPAAAHGRYAQ